MLRMEVTLMMVMTKNDGHSGGGSGDNDTDDNDVTTRMMFKIYSSPLSFGLQGSANKLSQCASAATRTQTQSTQSDRHSPVNMALAGASHRGPGSQPTPELPTWWPKEADGRTPARYLYRSMRADGTDLNHLAHDAQTCHHDSDAMRVHVCQAVVEGSRVRSPFLHASLSFHGACRFKALGIANRGESDTILVRLDLRKLYEVQALSQQSFISLVSLPAIKAFFTKSQEGYGEYVRDNFTHMIKLATNSKEILLKWRGTIPTCAFEVASLLSSYHLSAMASGGHIPPPLPSPSRG